MNSIGMDEAIKKGELGLAKVFKRKCGDDEDQDPPTDTEQEKKRRRRKDVEPSKKSSTSKESSKGKTTPKTSKTDKSVNAEETVEEPLLEMAMDVEKPILDDVVNDVDQPHDDADPKKTCFNDLVNFEKDPLTFDDMMATPIDFTKFSMNHPKKDKITKADFLCRINLIGKVLKIGNTERKYSASITKTKPARYELEGIEEMIPRL
ncbi:hypothetical protein Tco_0636995 [Tanacetum coccineum]